MNIQTLEQDVCASVEPREDGLVSPFKRRLRARSSTVSILSSLAEASGLEYLGASSDTVVYGSARKVHKVLVATTTTNPRDPKKGMPKRILQGQESQRIQDGNFELHRHIGRFLLLQYTESRMHPLDQYSQTAVIEQKRCNIAARLPEFFLPKPQSTEVDKDTLAWWVSENPRLAPQLYAIAEGARRTKNQSGYLLDLGGYSPIVFGSSAEDDEQRLYVIDGRPLTLATDGQEAYGFSEERLEHLFSTLARI